MVQRGSQFCPFAWAHNFLSSSMDSDISGCWPIFGSWHCGSCNSGLSPIYRRFFSSENDEHIEMFNPQYRLILWYSNNNLKSWLRKWDLAISIPRKCHVTANLWSKILLYVWLQITYPWTRLLESQCHSYCLFRDSFFLTDLKEN